MEAHHSLALSHTLFTHRRWRLTHRRWRLTHNRRWRLPLRSSTSVRDREKMISLLSLPQRDPRVKRKEGKTKRFVHEILLNALCFRFITFPCVCVYIHTPNLMCVCVCVCCVLQELESALTSFVQKLSQTGGSKSAEVKPTDHQSLEKVR